MLKCWRYLKSLAVIPLEYKMAERYTWGPRSLLAYMARIIVDENGWTRRPYGLPRARG